MRYSTVSAVIRDRKDEYRRNHVQLVYFLAWCTGFSVSCQITPALNGRMTITSGVNGSARWRIGCRCHSPWLRPVASLLITVVFIRFWIFSAFDNWSSSSWLGKPRFLAERYCVTFALWHEPSVCRSGVRLSSVTLLHHTHRVELFGNFLQLPNNLLIRTVCIKILGKNSNVF